MFEGPGHPVPVLKGAGAVVEVPDPAAYPTWLPGSDTRFVTVPRTPARYHPDGEGAACVRLPGRHLDLASHRPPPAKQTLAGAAVAAGHYDQSHKTTEFRRVMGATPRAYAKKLWPSLEACSANRP